MYLTLLAIPLLAALVPGLLGRKIGASGSHLITCVSMLLATMLAYIAFYEVGIGGSPVYIKVASWIDSEFLQINWAFLYDTLTVSMLIPVLTVSTLVLVYSIGYMNSDPHNQRFFSYLSMFTFFMLLLICGDNFIIMFIGWEAVGICSYLLINFWYTRIQANKSALQAIIMNRIGDWAFSIGLFAILWVFGNLDYATVYSLAPYLNESLIAFIGICLLGAAMGKSAQIPLHTWLPNAMEGQRWALLKLHRMREYPKSS